MISFTLSSTTINRLTKQRKLLRNLIYFDNRSKGSLVNVVENELAEDDRIN